jgi:2'-5' RNA ligase
MSLLRAFIALEIPSALQTAIESQAAHLRRTLPPPLVRWVPAHNLHLTLKFLGDISPAGVDLLVQMLASEAASFGPFTLDITGLGCFPNPRRARVIWVGMKAPAQLETLQHSVEAGAARLGYAAEQRPFSPHLTIGRVKPMISAADQKQVPLALEEARVEYIGSAKIHSITLMKSDLRPAGPVYTPLFAAPLAGRAEPRGES